MTSKQVIYKATYSYEVEVMDPKDFTITCEERVKERSFYDKDHAEKWLKSISAYRKLPTNQ